MTKRANFAATYSDWKLIRTRKVVQIVFEVPVEKADDAYSVLGGMPNSGEEIWCAIARLKESAVLADAAGAAPSPSSSAPAATPFRNHLTRRAGILCNDPMFHRYLEHMQDELGLAARHSYDKEHATNYLRSYCKVESRKDILPGTEAATRLDLLESAFVCWRDRDQFIEEAS
jgi:hypothetical protein